MARLTEERDRLREKLRKVEAALAKWSAVNEALQRGNAAESGPQELLPVEPSLTPGVVHPGDEPSLTPDILRPGEEVPPSPEDVAPPPSPAP
jgi:hypothetical protein